MNKANFKIFLPIIFALTLTIGIFVGSRMSNSGGIGSLFSVNYSNKDKINDVINLILNDYVDSIGRNQVTENTITALLSNLDPHSAYIPAQDLVAIKESMQGNFFGIGIQFRVWNDSVVVIKVIDDGPSMLGGIKAGERLVKADGIDLTRGMSNDSIMLLLKGPKGTTVKISVYNLVDKKLRVVEIKRDAIPYASILASYLIKDSIAYIKIDRFAATTYQEFSTALIDLGLKNFNTVIVDIENNGGGFLSTAIQITDDFLPKGALIVYTKGRNRQQESSYATEHESLKGKKLYILTNEMSASASEIFAGAIKDNDRGIIVGRRTFGKGLVQEQVDLPDNSAIRLTIARYYTPSGRCIQKSYSHGASSYYQEIANRYSKGELTNSDSANFSSKEIFKTKAGKIVYGGGGITPDIFVPIDTSGDYSYFNDLRNTGVFYDFAFYYIDKNRNAIMKKYPKEDDFINRFIVSKEMTSRLFANAAADKIKFKKPLSNKTFNEIKISLKAQIASDIYGENAYYKTLNSLDNIYNTALKAINKKL